MDSKEIKGLIEAYTEVYASKELTEDQVWEEVENWVNSLVEEGYDLSDYTWEEMYEAYLNEAPFKWNPNSNIIAAKDGKLGIMDKNNPNSWRQPSEEEKGEIPLSSTSKFKSSAAGQKFIQQRDASKANSGTASPTSKVAPTSTTPTASVTKPSPASTTPSTSAAPVSRQQELNALRQASARATMAGPSREAQALMSQRTKNILGTQKLETGVRAQQEVERMKSQVGMPKPEAPAPAPAPKTTQTQTQTKPQQQTTQSTLTSQQQKLYQQAYSNRNNPLAKGRIQSELSKMTPEQRKMFQQYSQSQGQGGDWGGYKFEEVIILNYLISEGYADNEKSARFIVENMSDNWKQSIIVNL